MRRFSDLTQQEFDDWVRAKRKVGEQEYGNKHLKRHGVVDFAEEMLDGVHILDLIFDRLQREHARKYDLIENKGLEIVELMEDVLHKLREFDAMIDDRHCTDEEGGDRIWWEESELIDTVWVRPDVGMEFLVHELSELRKDPVWFVRDYFNSNEENAMYFLGTVDAKMENGEYSYFNDEHKLDSIALDTNDGEVVEVEFMLIKMTEAELEGIGEFTGW